MAVETCIHNQLKSMQNQVNQKPQQVCESSTAKLADKSRFMCSVIPQQWSCRFHLQSPDISFNLSLHFDWDWKTRISCFAPEDNGLRQHLMTNGRLFFLQQAEYCGHGSSFRWSAFTCFFVSPTTGSELFAFPCPFTFQLIHSSR